MNTHKEPARGIPVPFRSMYETESEYRIAKEAYNKNMELRWKEPTPLSQIEEEPTEARLLKLEQEMAELYPRVEDLVRKVFNNTK